MIYLYVKTHNKTNFKYLGKTIKDPFVYKGSGKLWRQHLVEHGNDVRTEIIFQTNNKEEFREKAIYFSNFFNIVNDPDWANLTREEGQGGRTHSGPRGPNLKLKGRIPWNKGLSKDDPRVSKNVANMISSNKGSKKSEEHKAKLSSIAKNRKWSSEQREKYISKRLGVKRGPYKKKITHQLSV